ncbi:MAG: type 1 glutamine amidotransferase-like domain-containing protein, partial [Xanthomonadales bacterium]|nr:type 1 glutamine amidotransferase-like domain-containing protein [Xanthomonadales bacterium]
MTDAVERWVLGPQRPEQNISRAFSSSGLAEGPVAVISAGWQDAEAELDHVGELVGRPLSDLRLYQRAERLVQGDPVLKEAYRQRQDRLIELQRFYRRRMRQLSAAARELQAAEGDPALLAPERRHSIAQLRSLDTHHLNRVEAIHRDFEQQFSAAVYPAIEEQVDQIRSLLDGCSALLITGGNVVVLVNRMRLFGIGDLVSNLPLVAWSAGAMSLTKRIVLFHDYTPHGRRSPEVMGAGLGILPAHVFLPDARRRLRTRDALRTGMLARRFSPDTCVTLDNGSAASFHDQQMVVAEGVRRIDKRG